MVCLLLIGGALCEVYCLHFQTNVILKLVQRISGHFISRTSHRFQPWKYLNYNYLQHFDLFCDEPSSEVPVCIWHTALAKGSGLQSPEDLELEVYLTGNWSLIVVEQQTGYQSMLTVLLRVWYPEIQKGIFSLSTE